MTCQKYSIGKILKSFKRAYIQLYQLPSKKQADAYILILYIYGRKQVM